MNRKLREELNALSLKLFGASSRWQKLQKTTPIFSHYAEYAPNTKPYQQAKAEFARTAQPGEEFRAPQQAVYRHPTLDELREALIQQLDLLDYASGDIAKVTAKAATDFLSKKLPVAISLEVFPEEKEEFDSLHSQVNPDHRDWIDRMVSANLRPGEGLRLKGVAFLKALLEKSAA